MKTNGRAGPVVLCGALLGALVAVTPGCSLASSPGVASGGPTPGVSASPKPSPAPAAIPDYNRRIGNNRVAAEAALKLGRALYAQQQYWEVQVKTQPPTLRPGYDPGNPATFERAAREVSRIDITMATESGQAVVAFGAGGVEHEKTELTGLAKLLLSLFPSAQTIGFQVLYGESNPHAYATYEGGHLDYRKPVVG